MFTCKISRSVPKLKTGGVTVAGFALSKPIKVFFNSFFLDV